MLLLIDIDILACWCALTIDVHTRGEPKIFSFIKCIAIGPVP